MKGAAKHLLHAEETDMIELRITLKAPSNPRVWVCVNHLMQSAACTSCVLMQLGEAHGARELDGDTEVTPWCLVTSLIPEWEEAGTCSAWRSGGSVLGYNCRLRAEQ